MLSPLLTLAWWSAAGRRALRTLLVALIPALPAIITTDTPRIIPALATASLAVVLSLVTSLAHLPELTVVRAWWWAALDRAMRTFGQVLLAGVGTATLIGDVAWGSLLQAAAAAAAGSLLLAVVAVLPETQGQVLEGVVDYVDDLAVPAEHVVALLDADGATVLAGEAARYRTGEPLPVEAQVGELLTGPRHLAD